jgi:hypothetical protein
VRSRPDSLAHQHPEHVAGHEPQKEAVDEELGVRLTCVAAEADLRLVGATAHSLDHHPRLSVGAHEGRVEVLVARVRKEALEIGERLLSRRRKGTRVAGAGAVRLQQDELERLVGRGKVRLSERLGHAILGGDVGADTNLRGADERDGAAVAETQVAGEGYGLAGGEKAQLVEALDTCRRRLSPRGGSEREQHRQGDGDRA